jgi:ABC-type molybdate transport system substrate-binding protein
VKIFQKSSLVLVLALLSVIPLSACGGDASGPGGQRDAPNAITVLADSSLKGAFTQLGTQFESQSGATVTFTFGASADLAQQAAGGAAGDVLATADQADMNSAEKVQLGVVKIFATKGPATYQIVTLTQSKNTSLGQSFVNLVSSSSGQQALHQAGFRTP